MTNITNLEYNLEGILGLDHVQTILSKVSAADSNRPSRLKLTYLSKLWIISETLLEDEVGRNTQLIRNKYDNILSRHFTKNRIML